MEIPVDGGARYRPHRAALLEPFAFSMRSIPVLLEISELKRISAWLEPDIPGAPARRRGDNGAAVESNIKCYLPRKEGNFGPRDRSFARELPAVLFATGTTSVLEK